MGSGLLNKSLKNEIQEIRKKCNKICPVWTYFSLKKKKVCFPARTLEVGSKYNFYEVKRI